MIKVEDTISRVIICFLILLFLFYGFMFIGVELCYSIYWKELGGTGDLMQIIVQMMPISDGYL